jgi:hypothetical protein
MQTIRIQGRYGGPRLRDGLIVAFFRRSPFPQWSPQVRAVFELWLKTVPKEAVAWAAVGSSQAESKPLTSNTIAQALSQLDPSKVGEREINTFYVEGPEEVNPDFHFSMWGGQDSSEEERPERTNYVEMRFPTEWAGADGERLAEFTKAAADLLEYDSGYASLALHWSTDAELGAVAEDVMGIAFRHPGFDLHELATLRFDLGRRVVGARWMTLLGPDLAAQIGGSEGLRQQLAPDLQVEDLRHGLLLRCPGPPSPGDVNRHDDLPLLRRLAAVLEPITFFADDTRLFEDEDDYLRWQRRFLD